MCKSARKARAGLEGGLGLAGWGRADVPKLQGEPRQTASTSSVRPAPPPCCALPVYQLQMSSQSITSSSSACSNAVNDPSVDVLAAVGGASDSSGLIQNQRKRKRGRPRLNAAELQARPSPLVKKFL